VGGQRAELDACGSGHSPAAKHYADYVTIYSEEAHYFDGKNIHNFYYKKPLLRILAIIQIGVGQNN